MISFDPVNETVLHLEELIGQCGCFPGLIQSRENIIRLSGQIIRGFESADRPLRIVMAGGTGVGKSTLLNALAGAEIAKAGPVRPTTRHFTAYIHREQEDPWIETLSGVQVEYHQRPELARKIIVDAPDADSAERSHRHILEKAVQLADLVWVIGSTEKYISESVLRLLKTHSRGRRFVFILNKVDENDVPDMALDLKTEVEQAGFTEFRLFRISARNSFQKRTTAGGNLPQYDFDALVQYIEKELTELKIREIHRLNLSERAGILADTLESVLPPEYGDISGNWLESCESALSEYQKRIDVFLKHVLLNRDDLIPMIAARRTLGFGGLFGVAANMMVFLKRMTGRPRLSPDSGNLLQKLEQRLGTEDAATLSSGLQLLIETCIAEGSRLGIDREMLSVGFSREITPELTPVPEWVNRHAVRAVTTHIETEARPPGRIPSLALNLPPWAWIIYWVYRTLAPLFSSNPVSMQELPGAFIVLLMIVGLEYYLADRIIQITSRSRAERLIALSLSDMGRLFRAAFTPTVEKMAERIAGCADRLKTIIGKINDFGGPESAGRLDLPGPFPENNTPGGTDPVGGRVNRPSREGPDRDIYN